MKKALIFTGFLAALAAGLNHLPLSWIGNAVVPSTLQPPPVFLGTLWNGQIANIEGINPVKTRIQPWKIFRGEPPVTFESHSPFLTFSGNASLSGVVNAKASGNIAGLSVFDPRFRSLIGSYDVTLNDVKVREICEHASGQLSTDILTANQAALQWRGPVLSGPIACENGKFVAKLSGSDGQQSLSADFKLDLSGEYRAVVKVTSSDPRAEYVLPLYGFEKTSSGYSLSEAGAWR